MAITLTGGSATISTTEISMPTGTTYSSGSPQSSTVILQLFIDPVNVVAGDQFRIRIYEKVNGGTQQVVYEAFLSGVPTGLLVLPTLILGEAWDATLLKISGTDRSIGWSLRKVT